ncbi:16S rRNA pseudouridine(516) synthase [Thalassomonas haliotis]|uniref:Pseudouridine synthase n=1 Tax=Thalassomonas haliotis TaxID=485448 RepID=A0ABY7VMF6_9GAMM|nr:16S rRNA pseudouridine(516) synthase [Thalassomonas haliotis]WDE14170.1 pseudouridine synthase [Thalassomonas haliotis]
MTLSTSRLDRFISTQCQISRRDVRLMLAQKRILVDGVIANNIDHIIDKFSHISLDNQVLQANQASYVMLHKPVGVVSATKDAQHKTVLDILDLPGHVDKTDLHLVGRLDLNTSGLVLLTNDSRWSEGLTSPEKKVEKLYRVTLQNKLNADYIEAFNQGMYFAYEKITTRPAKLEIISDHVAMVSLVEGRYHQIKRMFGRFQNPVVALHRVAIGSLILTAQLKVGESRLLTPQEVAGI